MDRQKAFGLKNEIERLADRIAAGINGNPPFLYYYRQKAMDIGKYAKKLKDFVEANKDTELAKSCPIIDRSLFNRILSKLDFEASIQLSFIECSEALLGIQNYYLQEEYNISIKEIKEEHYKISPFDGELYEIDYDSGEYKKMPQDMPKDEYDTQPNKGGAGTSSDTDKQEYSQELLILFKNHTDLLGQLRGFTDDDKARKIAEWGKKKDKDGNLLIYAPSDNLYTRYAKALKENGFLDSVTVRTFRDKLSKYSK